MKLHIFKKISVALLTTTIIFSACKKDSGGGGSVSDGWKIGSTTYAKAVSTRSGSELIFMDNTYTAASTGGAFNMLSIHFNSTTGVAAGTYKIGNNYSSLAADEVAIIAGVGINSSADIGKGYAQSPLASTPATVTITDAGGGKLKVAMAATSFMEIDYSSSGGTPSGASVNVEINVTEM